MNSRYRSCVVAIPVMVLILVASRLVLAAGLPLTADEAYYWLWSKHLAGGYYDHPPAVAFVIRADTMLAGDSELGVRLVSVLLALPMTWAVFRTAEMLFGRHVAALAAIFLNLTLMVAAGTLIVTPDAPLMVAAAFILFFLAKVFVTGDGRWWALVGCGRRRRWVRTRLEIHRVVLWLVHSPLACARPQSSALDGIALALSRRRSCTRRVLAGDPLERRA